MVVQVLTTDLIRLMKNARVNLPGALDGSIQLELFNALNEFFTDSKVWQNTCDFATVVTTAGQYSYGITEDDPATMITLMSVVDVNDLLVPATMQIPGTIVLKNAPTVVETLTATFAVTVVDPVDSNDYPRMPDWVLKKYYAGILSGVISKMMTHPAKPYSNERMAIFHSRKFRAAVAVARAEARHMNLYGGQTWAYPTNFSSGSQR